MMVGQISCYHHAAALMIIIVAATMAFSVGTFCGVIYFGASMSVQTVDEFINSSNNNNNNFLLSPEDKYENYESINYFTGPTRDDNTMVANNRLHCLPTGQSLFIDIRHADPALLDSTEKLILAMIELLNVTNDVLLSYHCHSLMSMGVSCVGVFVESQVSYSAPVFSDRNVKYRNLTRRNLTTVSYGSLIHR